MSSLQNWLGIGVVSNDSLGPVLPQYSFFQLLVPPSNDTNFIGEPVTDASNNIYHHVYRQSDGKSTMLKTDSSGVIQWQYLLTGEASFAGTGAISSTNKIWMQLGGDILGVISPSGRIKSQTQFLSMGGRGNINIIKLDGSDNVYLASGVQRPDNYNTIHVYKLDSAGNWQWGTVIDPSAQSGGYDGMGLLIDSSGNVYITTTINYYDSVAGSYFYVGVIFKWNSSGTLQWQKRYNSTSREVDFGSSGIDSSGNLYVKGMLSHLTISDNPHSLTKIDSTGAVVWNKSITWPPADETTVVGSGWQDVVTDSSGNSYMFFGPSCPTLTSTEATNGSTTKSLSYYLVKYNNSGMMQWQRKLSVQGISVSGTFPLLPNPYINFDSTKQFLILRVANNDVVSVGYGPYNNNWIMIKVPVDGSLMGTYTFHSKTIVYGVASLTEHAAITIDAPVNDSWSVASVAQSITSGAISASAGNFTSEVVIINYGVSPAAGSVSEGSSLTFTVNTNNVTNGTVLYYNLSSLSTATTADFSSYSGSFTVNSNTGSFTVTLATDLIVESEYFYMDVRTGSISGTIVATSPAVSIVDTSPTYALTPRASSMNEGSSLVFDVATTNIANGTVLYFNLSSSYSSLSSRFSVYSGSCTITSNVSTFSITAATNAVFGDTTTFTMSLLTGSTTGTAVGTSSVVTLNDFSPTYSVSPASNTLIAGNSLVFTITTTNVPDNTKLYYTLENTNISSNFNSYSGTTNSIINNTVTFTVVTTSNATGLPATFAMVIKPNSTGTILATSSSVTLNYTPGTIYWTRKQWNNTGQVIGVGSAATNGTFVVIGNTSAFYGTVWVYNITTDVGTQVTLPAAKTSQPTAHVWYEQSKFTVFGSNADAVWQCSGDPSVSSNWTVTNITQLFPGAGGFLQGQDPKHAQSYMNGNYILLVSDQPGTTEYIAWSSNGTSWTRASVATTKATADNISCQSMATDGTNLLYMSRNSTAQGKFYSYNGGSTLTTNSHFVQNTLTTAPMLGPSVGITWTKEAGWIVCQTASNAPYAIRTTSLTTQSPFTTIPIAGGALRVVSTNPVLSSDPTRVLIAPNDLSANYKYSRDGGITWEDCILPTGNANGYTADTYCSYRNNNIYIINGYWGYIWVGTIA